MKIFISTLLFLTGCAGIGLMSTSDPYKKLNQAYWLMEQNRLILAEDMIRQSLEGFEKKEDKIGMSDAYHAYGNLYKNEMYVHGRCSETFKSMGTYDGTYMKSIKNFIKCAELYSELHDGMGEAKCLMGAGNAYNLRGESKQACDFYKKSLTTYQYAKAYDKKFVEPQMLMAKYSNMGELIKAFIGQERCTEGE